MARNLRPVKSEIHQRNIKRKIKSERTKTPSRFSRRLRHLEPELIISAFRFKSRMKQEKRDPRDLNPLSTVSSMTIRTNYQKPLFRKLKYPHSVNDSKEIISIYSAPKLRYQKSYHKKSSKVPKQLLRASSCKPKITIKKSNKINESFSPVKHRLQTPNRVFEKERLIENRKRYVLEILNKGDMRDIEKLQSVGSKTAERIMLYRQLKGSINKLSELAKIPEFPKQKYNQFMIKNFLKVD
ncbi:uncharacterized protein LOC115881850 isoform X2 [Sitophilus oryzae]|uniref:Uncharacterized protein LOC115881850 isoform X2 n=1 Tax=Sitophilus oryzae TaxID=7048 RepID=A0A6J2XXM7_SITOR|nr:uncharacterized protein LOC115881850 isoform X2 [Sitophilus oryzae]